MRSKLREQAHATDLLFTLGLFCVFSAAAFILVMIGIQVYQATVTQMQDTYSTRTALSYVVEKVRQHDVAGGVELGELEDAPALILHDEVGDDRYLTYIYADGSALCELTVREGTGASRKLGDAIIEVADFSIEDGGDGFLTFSAADSSGAAVRFLLHPRAAS